MNKIIRSIPEDNLDYPILIQIGSSSGSGFFFRHLPTKKIFLATASHVLFDSQTGELLGPEITLTVPNKAYSNKPGKLVIGVSEAIIRRKAEVDLAILEIAASEDVEGESFSVNFLPIVKSASKGGHIVTVHFDSFLKFNDVIVGNDIFVLGYPNSLTGGQIESFRPLLRKGIVAGINKSNSTVLIDAPVYFGNSGGLVLQVNNYSNDAYEIKPIGIVTEYVPFVEHLYSVELGYMNQSIENSGYAVVVPTDTIFDLVGETPEKNLEVKQTRKKNSTKLEH